MGNSNSVPETCKAAVYGKVSTEPSDVKVIDAPVLPAGPGLVIVKAEFASVNPIDYLVQAGHLQAAGWVLPLPFTMGYDIAGKVVAVGKGVAGFKVGDSVFGVNWGQNNHNVEDGPVAGTFKEYVTIKGSMLSHVPKRCPKDKAAAVALVGTTAYQALSVALQVKKGDRILILGGAGAVGRIAIQLAKEMGAWVATTASPRTMDFVKQIKPDLIINYREQKWYESPELKDVDGIFAAVGEETSWTHAKKILKKGGRFVSISDQEAGFDPSGHAAEGYPYASFMVISNSTEVQDTLAKAIVDKKLDVVVDAVFPFTQEGVQELLKKQASGASMGKNVLKF